MICPRRQKLDRKPPIFVRGGRLRNASKFFRDLKRNARNYGARRVQYNASDSARCGGLGKPRSVKDRSNDSEPKAEPTGPRTWQGETIRIIKHPCTPRRSRVSGSRER